MTSANPRMADCDRKAARHTWVYRITQVVFFLAVIVVVGVLSTVDG